MSYLASTIKSVQPFSITLTDPATTGTQAIGTVDTTKSVVLMTGFRTNLNNLNQFMTLTLTSATLVTAERGSGGAGGTSTISAVVIEFK